MQALLLRHRLHVFAIALLGALLLGLSAVGRAHAQPPSLEGVLHAVWGDGPDNSNLRLPPRFFLADGKGHHQEIVIDPALVRQAGGIAALNRRHVKVVGAPVSARDGRIRAQALDPTVSRSGTRTAAAADAVIGSQPFVTVLCRFSDTPNVTPHPVSWFEGLLGSAYPGIDHMWRQVSFNNINLTGSVIHGWYNLPLPRSSYIDWFGADLEALARDCTAAADADVFFPSFIGVNLIFNADLGCCAWGGSLDLARDGQTKGYSMTWMPPWGYENQHVLGHEMGHGFGLPHSSGPYDATYDSRWDVMSKGGTCSVQDGAQATGRDPVYGCVGVHTIAYHKDFLGWIPAERRFVPTSSGSQTITIERLAEPTTTGGYLMAKIPIRGSSTNFYTVEVRRGAGYDDHIPSDAVIIHEVDTTREDRLAQVVDQDSNGNPNDDGARWLPGETFTNLVNGITVKVESATAAGFVVTIGGGTGGSGNAPALFAQLPYAQGVTTDAAGNLFVHHDTGFGFTVKKFKPDGTLVWSVPIGGFFDTGFAGRLVTDPGTGMILDLLTTGIIIQIDPTSGQVKTLLDLRPTPPDARRVWDVALGSYRDFSGDIVPSHLSYGDIAVLRRGGQLDLFITGVALNTAFVMRARVLADGTAVPPKALVASWATTAGTVNQPRGVAVGATGTVLTSLPIGGAAGAYDVAVAFAADLEQASAAPRILLDKSDLTSFGMATDAAGNFYVATGPVGTSLCGAGGSGALVILPPTLDSFRCGTFDRIIADSRDVAVNPAGDRAYVAVMKFDVDEVGGVFFFKLVPPKAADLALTITDAPDPATVGAEVTYTLTVKNNGPLAATGVTLTDTLPAGVTLVSATPSATCTGTGTVTCTLGSLAAGGAATVTVVVKPTAEGTLTNRASVTAAETDSNPANNQVTVTTTVAPAPSVPAAPTGLRLGTVTSSSIQIVWTDNATNETGFEVRHRPTGTAGWTSVSLGAGTTSWAHTGLSAGAAFDYEVRACNGAGCSTWSNTLQGQTTAPLPAAPTSLRAGAVTENSIEIAWTDNATNETRFEIAYDSTVPPGWTYVSVGADSTKWTHTGLRPGSGYFYYVRACNTTGCSAWSNQLWTATVGPQPAAPSNLRLGTVTGSSIQLLWNDNSGIETYQQVAYRPAGGPSWTYVTVAANGTSWTHTGVSAGVSYTYYVRACNGSGCSAWSNPLAGTAGSATTLAAGHEDGTDAPPQANDPPAPGRPPGRGAPPPSDAPAPGRPSRGGR